MNNRGSDGRHMSRRVALSGAALALGVAAIATAVSQAAAQQKNGCVNFQPPNACKFVQGDISPSGWCQLFTPKS